MRVLRLPQEMVGLGSPADQTSSGNESARSRPPKPLDAFNSRFQTELSRRQLT